MRGFPKVIRTVQDIENCLELVQKGDLDALQLQHKLEAIERRMYLFIPYVEISTDRKTVKTLFLNEAVAGQAGNCTILNIQHEVDPNPQEGTNQGEFAFTVLTLESALPDGEKVIKIPSPAPPSIDMNATTTAVQTIKAQVMTLKGAI